MFSVVTTQAFPFQMFSLAPDAKAKYIAVLLRTTAYVVLSTCLATSRVSKSGIRTETDSTDASRSSPKTGATNSGSATFSDRVPTICPSMSASAVFPSSVLDLSASRNPTAEPTTTMAKTILCTMRKSPQRIKRNFFLFCSFAWDTYSRTTWTTSPPEIIPELSMSAALSMSKIALSCESTTPSWLASGSKDASVMPPIVVLNSAKF
mmetsp:Transcript_71585/g.119047  ORF Transcript_71585/g.119047 Transcript_71585/m.119047 type:complete len:207 (+) Transcript_71585:81-701(+)